MIIFIFYVDTPHLMKVKKPIKFHKTKNKQKRRFTMYDKVNVLTLWFSGESYTNIIHTYRIDKKELSLWRKRFLTYGILGLQPLRKCTFPEEYKREVVKACLRGDKSKREVAVEYNVSFSSLKNWCKQYASEIQENNN